MSRIFKEIFLIKLLKLSTLNIIVALLQLLFIFSISKYHGLKILGEITLISTIIYFIEDLIKFQLWQTILPDIVTNEHRINRLTIIINNCLSLEFISNILIGFVLFIVLKINNYDTFVIIGALFITIFKFTSFSTTIFRSSENQSLYTLAIGIVTIIKIILAFFLIPKIGGVVFFIIMEFLQLLVLHILLLKILKKYKYKFVFYRYSLNYFKIKDKYFKQLFISNVQLSVKAFVRYIDVFVSQYLFGSQIVGLIKIAKTSSQIFGFIIDPIVQTVFPKLVIKDNYELKKIFDKSIQLGVILFFVASLFYIITLFIIKTYCNQIYTSKFFYPTIIYAFASLIQLCGSFLYPLMLTIKHFVSSLNILIIHSALYILFIFVFSRIFGILGIPFAFLLFYIFWTTHTYSHLKNYFHEHRKQI